VSYAYQYVRNRVVFALVMVAISAAFALWYFPSDKPEIRSVMGTVIELNQGSTTSIRTGQEAELVTARVQLDDGQEVRLMVLGRRPQSGQRVSVIERRYADGQRRYTLAPPEDAAY
jgi:hypothetical protein